MVIEHAVFIVMKGEPGDDGRPAIAAVTRPDKGIGLPGGKVEPGETVREAVLREAMEEGWDVSRLKPDDLSTICSRMVDGFVVTWFLAPPGAYQVLPDHKEKGRVDPLMATVRDIALSGMGNGHALCAAGILSEEDLLDLQENVRSGARADCSPGLP